MFIKYIFHKNQKCAPQTGVNIKKVTSISENENFEILIEFLNSNQFTESKNIEI